MIWLLACDSEPTPSKPDEETGTPAPAASEAWATIAGDSAYALGNDVASAGDVDGDGDGDLLLAAYLGNRVCVVTAPVPAGDSALDTVAACLTGEAEPDYAGYGMAAAGDATGDGVDDILVGSIGNGDAGANAGKVYLVPGPVTAGSLGERAWATFTGETAGDYAGLELARGGDLTGDGVEDFLVGASGYDGEGGGGGRAYVVAGPITPGAHLLADAWASVTGLSAAPIDTGPADTGAMAAPPPHGSFGTGDFIGDAFAGPGDFDGDGVADLALGASGDDTLGLNTGKVAVFSGPVAPGAHLVTDADRTLDGPAAGSYAGSPLRAVPDLDGDGLDDLLVSLDGLRAGEVYVLGATATALDDAAIRFVGAADKDLFGYATAAADVDADGDVDLAIGGSGGDAAVVDAGAAWLFRGPFSPGTYAAADVRAWGGTGEGDAFGAALDLPGDLNADGVADLVVGARNNRDAGGYAGKVFLFEVTE